MKLQTYANLMNQTADFPWTSYLGNKEKGEKEQRVNQLARGLFYRDFCRKYSEKEIVFENDSGKEIALKLKTPKFEANHTRYNLHFTEDKLTFDKLGLPQHNVQYNPLSSFWISNDGSIMFGGERKLKETLGESWKLKEDSVKLIYEMLSYQPGFKNQNGKRFLNERLEGAKYAGYNNKKYQEFINERNGWNKPEENQTNKVKSTGLVKKSQIPLLKTFNSY